MGGRARRGYKDASLQQLRSFCEVCRHGSYTAAAHALGLTIPAVWEQMRGLEQHYGVTLLRRCGNGVRPTAEGERLLELVQPHLAGLASTRDLLQQEGGGLPRQVALVSNLRVLADEVSRALHTFRSRYPGVRVRLDFVGIDEVGPRVLGGAADVAFTLEPGPDRPSTAAVV